MKKQKICIIGNGLTGLIAALALSKLNIEIHLAGRFKSKKKFLDNRTTAISPSNYNFLLKFLDKKHSKLFWATKKIDLYHEESDRYFNFMNFENNGKNLMYIVRNYKLIESILKKIKNQKKIKIINTEVRKIDEKKPTVFLKNKEINYDCILLCAGKRSQLVSDLLGKRVVGDDLNDIAFTSIIKHNLNIINSKQYFLKEGPLAILPISNKEFSLVWSVNKNYKSNITENLIREKLKRTLGLDKKVNISKINFFPISFNFNVNFLKKNVLVLGEGSYNIHPVAGQGFNLILRDIKKLSEEIEEHLSLGMQLRDSRIFQQFTASRKPENFLFGLSINLIHKFFGNNKVNNPVKKIILKDINKLKFLKELNLRIADRGIF
mgnify:CR=1 FL=1|tara:strand:- start:2329 stop:3462 length:1134 start_codon:yes stop_codon:yes gene_type:complete